MSDYTGIKCPVCGKPFQTGDDIVVCPQCGAPYHRDCYQNEGKCIFDDLHEQGKNWEPPTAPTHPDVSAEIKDQECPNCGKLNAHSALFCDQCGSSLSGSPAQHNNRKTTQNNTQNPYAQPPQNGNSPFPNNSNGPFPGNSPFPGGGMGGAPMPFALDPMGGVAPQELIDDIPAEEIAKLVQTNTAYYLPTFRNIKTYKRGRFNFCAFLFSGGWMLYRKQYKFGAIITALMFALFITYTYINAVWTAPLIQQLFTEIGADPNTVALTSQQANMILDLLWQNPHDLFIFLLPTAILGIMLIVMLFTGLRGNHMYMNHCLKTIHKLRTQNLPAAEYHVQLQTHGNVNVPITICLLVCYMIVTWLPRFL
ncbi:MAG TPA: hypothetical protein IAA80_09100 [Candidatus Gallacutalibacter pullistercoris]|nr:hypothetical protein [Candidatus Gallacutalibacter pullistercoris]